ncbi:MAG: adenylate kinase [Acidimicrobiia bacterium]|nr:adenylate kinase [Acidimicrobiia bacterium]
MGRRLLLVGPPGAGKGTQAERLARALGVPHISTGEMLRDHVVKGTALGTEAKRIMDTGALVPDEVVVAMVAARLAEDDALCGYLLDGFPRNDAQADALEAAVGPDAIETVLHLTVPEDELVARLLARGRSDDTEESIRTRLGVYREETEPLAARYEAAGTLRIVDGLGTIEDISGRIFELLAS